MCACICVCTFACLHMCVCMCFGVCLQVACVYVCTCFHMHVFTCMLYVDACAHWSRGAIQWGAISSFGEAVINSYAVTGHLGLVLCLLVTTCP